MLNIEADTTRLIAQAQKGSQEALGALYDRYYTGVFHYLYYRVSDLHVAEDLASDVFLRMVNSLPGFTPRTTALQAWLFQVARNLAIDHYRKASTRLQVPLDDTLPGAGSDPTLAVEQRLAYERLSHALQALLPDQRDVIILRFISGLSLSQTAHILHKSDDAVKGLQRRALEALRSHLQEWKVEDEQLR